MDATTENRETGNLPIFLSGLQGGMIGVLWMLAWLGVSATWQRRSFWTAENLLASAFYGDSAIRSGFAFSTLSGLALYLLLYSVLGAVFAGVLRDRASRQRTLLLGMAYGLVWYYVAYHLLWKSLLPLVALLHTERPTLIGHLLYGIILGRYPRYGQQQTTPAAAAEIPEETEVKQPE